MWGEIIKSSKDEQAEPVPPENISRGPLLTANLSRGRVTLLLEEVGFVLYTANTDTTTLFTKTGDILFSMAGVELYTVVTEALEEYHT